MSQAESDDQARFDREMAVDRAAYEALRDQIRRDYQNQYVAMAFGKIVAVSPDFDEAVAAVKRLQPAPEHYLVFLAEEGPIFEPVEAYYKEFL
jgi:hypothetical protein